MRRSLLATAALLARLAVAVLPGQIAALPGSGGEPAPVFELPLLDGSGSVTSALLFASHERVFLVFWWSGCPRCVESLGGCEAFHRARGGEETAVVGIDGDQGDLFVVRAILQASGVSFAQLRDPGGAVAASYGIPIGTFSVCLVGRCGDVLDVRIDPQGDISAAMEDMSERSRDAPLRPLRREAPAEESRQGAWRPSFAGEQRIRFLGIDARGSRAVGSYGEALAPGNRLDHRLEVEMTTRIRGGLRVGGLLRIGTEGQEVLDAGPKYLGSRWGSAFAEVEAGNLGARIGYYTLAMTPLTLMRWDWDDSPRSGGAAGCGCAAAAAALRFESLDDLTPELTFEGGMLRFGTGAFEARAFWALPRRAIETGYSSHRFGGDPRARFALQLYGFEARWQRLANRSGGFWRAALHAAGTSEDRRTVDFRALGYPASDPWTESWIVTASAEVPVVRHVRLRGEIVGWNRSEEHGVTTLEGMHDVARQGNGGFGGVVVETPRGLAVKLDYLRLDEGFHSDFAALSYAANEQGVRASAEFPAPRRGVVLSLYYERLHEVQPPHAGDPRQRSDLFGVALDVPIARALGASAGWIEEEAWRHGGAEPFDRRRRAFTTSLRWELGRAAGVTLQYQRTTSEDDSAGLGTSSAADIYALQTRFAF